MSEKLRVGVIGVGHLGRHHARLLAAMPGVQLVAVADTDRRRREEVGRALGVRAFDDAASLMGEVDAVTVAVPTDQHRDVALPFLLAGVPALVEKPLARTLEEADELIAAAQRASVPLAVGHTERFNPAVVAAAPLLADPRFIEVHRLGAFPERSLDIDVVFDLMIHDLDVVLSLVPSPVEAIEAVGVPVLTNRVDIANVRLRFENGCIANLTASRISRDRVRKIRFFQPAAYLSIDYAAQKLEVWRLVRRGDQGTIEGGEMPVEHQEPLGAELADFVSAVSDGRSPVVSGIEGRRALALAQAITEKMAESVTPFRQR